jgi:hypothetical protein
VTTTDRPPLFIPLRAEHYNAFRDGTKTTEYRRFGPGWNGDTCAAWAWLPMARSSS